MLTHLTTFNLGYSCRTYKLNPPCYTLILSLCICVGVFSTWAIGSFPYLYKYDFLHRMFFWFILWLLGIVLFFCTAPKWHVKYFIHERKTEYIKLSLAFIVLCAACSFVSSNITGHLVNMFSTKYYEQKFLVITSKTLGSSRRYPHPALNLGLQLENNDDFYNLEVDKSRFNYTKGQFRVNDKIILTGRKNCFGVVIDTIQLHHQSE